MQTGVGAVEGDANVRKKFRAIWVSQEKKVVGNPHPVDREEDRKSVVKGKSACNCTKGGDRAGKAYVGPHARLQRKRTQNERCVRSGQCFMAFSRGKS